MFFDDDESNVKTVSKLGVSCVRVSKGSGLTFDAVRSGLKKYRQACLSRSNLRAWLQPLPPKGEARVDEKAVAAHSGQENHHCRENEAR